MSDKTKTHGPAVKDLEIKPDTLPAVLTHKEIVDFLSRIPMDTPDKAMLAFAWAKSASEFMRKGTQKAVNADFMAEMPAAQAGQDVDGSQLKVSVSTRQKFEKISKAMEWAGESAQSLIVPAK